MLLYIVEAKKGRKKKSLNILSLAAYLLKSTFQDFKVLYTMKLPYEITGSQGCLNIQTVHFLCGISAIFGDQKCATRHLRLLQGTHDILTTDVRVRTYIFVLQCRKTAARSPCNDHALYCKAATRFLQNIQLPQKFAQLPHDHTPGTVRRLSVLRKA